MFKRLHQTLLFSMFLLFQIASVPAIVSAAPCPNDSFLGLPAWYSYLECGTDSGKLSPEINEPSDALPIGIAVLEGMIRLGGLIAVVMVFIGAFKFITSQGNGDAAASARKTVINALIGLVIIIVATATVSFIGNTIR